MMVTACIWESLGNQPIKCRGIAGQPINPNPPTETREERLRRVSQHSVHISTHLMPSLPSWETESALHQHAICRPRQMHGMPNRQNLTPWTTTSWREILTMIHSRLLCQTTDPTLRRTSAKSQAMGWASMRRSRSPRRQEFHGSNLTKNGIVSRFIPCHATGLHMLRRDQTSFTEGHTGTAQAGTGFEAKGKGSRGTCRSSPPWS